MLLSAFCPLLLHLCLQPAAPCLTGGFTWSISTHKRHVHLQAHGVMWALKGSLAKEPLMTEDFLGSCMAALRPVQTAQLIVAYFPRTVWPDLFAFCSAVLPRNGSSTASRGHA